MDGESPASGGTGDDGCGGRRALSFRTLHYFSSRSAGTRYVRGDSEESAEVPLKRTPLSCSLIRRSSPTTTTSRLPRGEANVSSGRTSFSRSDMAKPPFCAALALHRKEAARQPYVYARPHHRDCSKTFLGERAENKGCGNAARILVRQYAVSSAPQITTIRVGISSGTKDTATLACQVNTAVDRLPALRENNVFGALLWEAKKTQLNPRCFRRKKEQRQSEERGYEQRDS